MLSEKDYYSFSNVEDVTRIIEEYDYTFAFKNLSEKHFNIYIDLQRLLKQIDSLYVKTYLDVMIGKTTVSSTNDNSNILKKSSSILKVREDVFKKRMDSEIKEIVKQNKKNWLKYVRNNYSNKNLEGKIEDKNRENLEALTDNIDKVSNKTNKTNKKCTPTPEELDRMNKDILDYKQLINFIEKRLKVLKNKGKEKELEYRKLLSTKIEIQKDINIIRRFYGDKIGSQNSLGKTVVLSYNDSLDSACSPRIYEQQLKIHEQQKLLEKIRGIAKEVLTKNQYIAFEFYYFNEINQSEIAEIMGVSQQMIQKSLAASVKKIREEIKKRL